MSAKPTSKLVTVGLPIGLLVVGLVVGYYYSELSVEQIEKSANERHLELRVLELEGQVKIAKNIHAQTSAIADMFEPLYEKVDGLSEIDQKSIIAQLAETLDSPVFPPMINSMSDTDGDGFIDKEDNCPTVRNPYQTDFDGDGRGGSM